MGVAMNHAAAVAMPLVGGALWVTLGHQWTFLAGAVAAALSVVAALQVPALVARVTVPADARREEAFAK